MIVHSLFAGFSLIICFYILSILMKFFASNILILLNSKFIEALFIKNLLVLYIAPVCIFIIIIFLIKILFTILRINYTDLLKKIIAEKTKSSLSTTKFKGGRF